MSSYRTPPYEIPIPGSTSPKSVEDQLFPKKQQITRHPRGILFHDHCLPRLPVRHRSQWDPEGARSMHKHTKNRLGQSLNDSSHVNPLSSIARNLYLTLYPLSLWTRHSLDPLLLSSIIWSLYRDPSQETDYSPLQVWNWWEGRKAQWFGGKGNKDGVGSGTEMTCKMLYRNYERSNDDGERTGDADVSFCQVVLG